MNKINILYITCFGSLRGGGQRSLYLLIKHLDKERFCPSLIVPEAGDVKDAVEALGVKVFVLPPTRLRSLRIGGIRRTLWELRRIIEETQAHLISTDSVRETFYARRAGRSRGVPVLLHLRVTDSPAWVDGMLYGLVDRMIAVSHAAAGRFRDRDKKGKVCVVYNGADLQALQPAPARPPDGRLRIGYFGRLHARKGIDTLIKAVRRLEAAPVSLHIFGEGEKAYERYLKKLASGNDRIVFEGYVQDVPKRIRGLDLVALASRRTEGLSRALIEAMALGRPVIVSDVPSNPELVGDDLRSFVFRHDDDADLARILKDLYRNPQRLRDVGLQARRRAEVFFDLIKNTRQIEEVYRQTVRRTGPSVGPTARSASGRTLPSASGRTHVETQPQTRAPASARPSLEARKILVINLGGIGDLFLSSAALRVLRSYFRQARIVFCGVPRTAAFARRLGVFDEVVPFTGYEEGARRFALSRLRSFVGFLVALRRERFDLAVNMRTLHSRLAAWKMAFLFFAIGPRTRAGRDTDGRGFFLNVKVLETTRGEKHETEYDLDTVRALGAAVSDVSLKVDVPESSRQAVAAFLERNGISATERLIGANPGGALSHRWPLVHFGTALKQLADRRPCAVVVTGGKGEKGLGEALVGALRGYRVVNAVGRFSWEELCAFLERCDLFITNDTGPMHVAAALKTPMVALFGPGYLTRFDPRHLSEKAIVLHEQAACAPCDKLSCRDLRCLKRITPQAVVSAGLELLERDAK